MSSWRRMDVLGPHVRARPRLIIGASASSSTLFDHGLPYSMKLRAHSSCINALALSSNEGRFLASGGDDLDVHLWDFHQEDITEPCHTFIGPRSNIFCLEFSRSNQYLFVAGTDTMVHQYDVSRLGSDSNSRNDGLPTNMFRENDTVRDVTCSPFHDEIFLSGSDNGRIIQHDARLSPSSNLRAADIIQLTAEVTSIKFHPTMEHLFLTSDSKSNVHLRDSRMAFGPQKSRSKEGIVRSFHTTIAKRNIGTMSNPESSSVAFDREGQKLAVTSLHYYPTIYSISNPYPIAICTDNSVERSSGQRRYSNSCTMKHGSFGRPEPNSVVDYYCGGSDDFCGYVWKIPPVETLIAQRDEISANEWRMEDSDMIGFTEKIDAPVFVPTELSTPSAILRGHNSIVNTTLIHPQFPLILTAGIESAIVLHSPFASCPFSQKLSPTPQEVRQLPSSTTLEEVRVIDPLSLQPESADRVNPDETELDTIRLFDSILRREGETDPFEVRPWVQVSEDENEASSDTSSI